MRILVIGGMGIIGGSITRAAADHHNEVWAVSRSKPAGEWAQLPVRYIQGDWYNDSFANSLLSGDFDVIVDALVFTVNHIKRSTRLANGHCKQYIYISTDSVYPHPGTDISEDDVSEPGLVKWKYGCDKLKCEQYLKAHGSAFSFKWTIVRPTITFGDTRIPVGFSSRRNTCNLPDRITLHKPLLRFDDVSSRHAVCHVDIFGNAFLSLLLNDRAANRCFNISDGNAYTYDEIFRSIERALGTECVFIHMPPEIVKRYNKSLYEDLIYDKNMDFTLNNDRIRSMCPGMDLNIDIDNAISGTIANLKECSSIVRQDDDYDLLTDLILMKHINKIQDAGERQIASDYVNCFPDEYVITLRHYGRKCIIGNVLSQLNRGLSSLKHFIKGVLSR